MLDEQVETYLAVSDRLGEVHLTFTWLEKLLFSLDKYFSHDNDFFKVIIVKKVESKKTAFSALHAEVHFVELLEHLLAGAEGDALAGDGSCTSAFEVSRDLRVNGEVKASHVTEFHRVAVADEFSYLSDEAAIHRRNLFYTHARVFSSIADEVLIVDFCSARYIGEVAFFLVNGTNVFVDLHPHEWIHFSHNCCWNLWEMSSSAFATLPDAHIVPG